MKKVYWFLNHKANSEQIENLKFWLEDQDVNLVEMPEAVAKRYANVDLAMDPSMVHAEAVDIALRMPVVVADNKRDIVAVIQGQPGLQTELVRFYQKLGIKCFYATTKRESVEVVNADGTTTKTSIFKHVRFTAYPDIAADYSALAKSPLE